MTLGERDEARIVFELSGEDRIEFLQGLLSADIKKAAEAIQYAALLSPQGKFLTDLFVAPLGEGSLLLDLPKAAADDFERRMTLYRLRAKVSLTRSALQVQRGLGAAPEGAHQDPRTPAMGWRAYSASAGLDPAIDWDSLRIAHLVPEYGRELFPNDSYILEYGFERLNGVDFRKGCYVGQEVTARMKHKTELKKGLVRLKVTGEAPEGTPIATADGKEAGVLHSRAGDLALGWLRFDRAEAGGLVAAGAAVELLAS